MLRVISEENKLTVKGGDRIRSVAAFFSNYSLFENSYSSSIFNICGKGSSERFKMPCIRAMAMP